MLYIDDSIIYITQNDDAAIDVIMTLNDNSKYVMSSTETLTLTVRAMPDISSSVLLSITSMPGSNRIVIRGEDTANVLPGRYSMDVQLNRDDKTKYTVIPNNIAAADRHKVRNWKNFVIMPEVTTP